MFQRLVVRSHIDMESKRHLSVIAKLSSEHTKKNKVAFGLPAKRSFGDN
jgi:hypothetical protein